jgi:hypothetical protein
MPTTFRPVCVPTPPAEADREQEARRRERELRELRQLMESIPGFDR